MACDLAQKVLIGAVLFTAVVAGSAARAGEMHVLINGKAIHFNEQSGAQYNENNWGAGFQYDWTRENRRWRPFLTASGFRDSNTNASYYAGGGWLYRRHFYRGGKRLHADAGVIGFFMVREGYKNDNPFPGVLPAFSIGNEAVAVNMTYVPKVDPKSVPLVFFQLKIKLGAR